MPNTFTEKAMKQPFRVGLMLGALALPTLWTLSQDALNLLMRQPLLNSEKVTQLFALGCLPGMILGAALTRAWVANRQNRLGEARWLLISNGVITTLLCLFVVLVGTWDEPRRLLNYSLSEALRFFYFNFPLQCALAVLLWGVLMRSPRA